MFHSTLRDGDDDTRTLQQVTHEGEMLRLWQLLPDDAGVTLSGQFMYDYETVSTEQFGEGSFDKGIYLTFPFYGT